MTLTLPPQTSTAPPGAGVPNDFIMKLSVGQYHDMIRNGILTDDDPVELVDGWLIAKMPKDPPHAAATNLVRRALSALLPAGFHLRVQDPITLSDGEPEPDVAVVRGDERSYTSRHPAPSETPIVVEVADSSLERDRGLKQRSYARAGINLYWIINLQDRQVEVFETSAPRSGGYPPPTIFKSGQRLAVQIDGQQIGEVEVDSLLP